MVGMTSNAKNDFARTTEVKNSQKYVQKTADAIFGFNDPFSIETDQFVGCHRLSLLLGK